jgi:hypothetical protein
MRTLAWRVMALVAIAVGQAMAQSPGPSLESYRLTMANIKKVAATYTRLDSLLQAQPALAASFAKQNEATSPEDIVAKVNANPVMSKTVAAVGISARDFVLTELVLFTTGMTAFAVQAGAPAPTAPAAIANLQLYHQNRAEIEQITAALKQLSIWHTLRPDENDESDEP